jgi:uncharacterized membrane protein
MHYFPLALPFILLLFLLFVALIATIEIGIIGYAYEKIGINRRYVFVLLALSLLGSYVNIPVAELARERVLSNEEVYFFGMRYVIPLVQEWPGTVIAVNLGGAVVPTLVSAYLLWKNGMVGRILTAVVIVTIVVHILAQPVRGVGIAVPTLIPPLVAAGVGFLLSRKSAPALARTSSTSDAFRG